jgi:hypothetical protein
MHTWAMPNQATLAGRARKTNLDRTGDHAQARSVCW